MCPYSTVCTASVKTLNGPYTINIIIKTNKQTNKQKKKKKKKMGFVYPPEYRLVTKQTNKLTNKNQKLQQNFVSHLYILDEI